MESLLLQDFTTVRGTRSTSVVQSRHGYLDLGGLEDLAVYIDVREVTGPPNLTLQTAPAAIDSAFVGLTSAIALTAGLTTIPLMASRGGVSPGRFLRWQLSLTTAATWDATLRLWVAAYGWT